MYPPFRLVLGPVVCAVVAAGCGWEQHAPSPGVGDSDNRSSISVRSVPPYGTPDLPGDEEAEGLETGRGTAASDLSQENAFYLVGTTADIWRVDDWAGGDPVRWTDLRGKVVVVRFFDIDSEACERSMKALQQLHEEFAGRPVMFVGIHRTSESDRGPEWQTVVDQVRQWGVTFPVARDKHGATLQRWWLRYLYNMPQTPAFVIGPDGRIAYVQPGPEFYPSEDLMFALCNRDFLAVRQAVQAVLPQEVARRSAGTEAVADVP